MKIIWADEAKGDLRRIFDHILSENPSAARRVIKQIRSSALRLADFPRSARVGRVANTRELVVTDLPCIVVYEIAAEAIEVLTVRHTSQEWPESFSEEQEQ